MDFKSRKVSSLIAIALIAGAASLVGFFALYDTFIPEETEPAPLPSSSYIAVQTALDIAFAEAKKWHEDAELARIFPDGGATDERGNSTILRAWFSSPTAQEGAGFEVWIRAGAVERAEEVALSRKGGPLPEGHLMTQDEALAYVRALPGYEDATVEYLELFYARNSGQWFWGIKTSKGELSIEAARLP